MHSIVMKFSTSFLWITEGNVSNPPGPVEGYLEHMEPTLAQEAEALPLVGEGESFFQVGVQVPVPIP